MSVYGLLRTFFRHFFRHFVFIGFRFDFLEEAILSSLNFLETFWKPF